MSIHKEEIIESVLWKGHLKVLRTKSGRALTVPLSACVSKGDAIRINADSAWTICKNGVSQFLPSYFKREKIKLGGIELRVAIKEIDKADEYEAYKALSEFHYRGQIIHGRTARLIMRSFHPAYPKVIGYIELATPFYMNKARSLLLDAPFVSDGVQWNRWDMPTLRKYIHIIVRIARIVVLPEFRGIGIGQKLIKHAVEFARYRWQVAGYLPYFIEISADMLKYVPFAERAGMIFVGETEGNLNRVAKDMEYLISRFSRDQTGLSAFEESCGICDQQISRMTAAIKLMEKERLTKKNLINRLRALSHEKVLKDFALFHKIVSLPKPHYMLGLNPDAQKFIHERVKILSPQNGRKPPSVNLTPIKEAIRIRDLEISYFSKVRRTKTTHVVQQAFGISPNNLQHTVIKGLSIDIFPGEIVLVCGPSGSGKTSLLNVLTESKRQGQVRSGNISIPQNTHFGHFQPIKSLKPLIEILGVKDVHYGLYLLGLAGLSEPYLYLKKFKELSAGQQYRAMLAHLLASECNVWIADEFCANLDPITANVVSHNLQKIARKVSATVIAAASHSINFIFSLKPDKVVQLTSASTYSIISGDEYCSKLKKQLKNDRIGF